MTRMDRTVSSGIGTSGMGRVTVPMNYADSDGRINAGVKVKLNRKVPPAMIEGALPEMQTDPKYDAVYKACYAKAKRLYATKGSRVVGFEALKMAERRIAKLEREAQASQSEPSPPVRRPKTAAKAAAGNTLADWDAAVGDVDEILDALSAVEEPPEALDDDWDETTLEQLEEMRQMSAKPRRSAAAKVRQAEPDEADWSDGLQAAPVRRRAPQAAAQVDDDEGWLGVPGLGSIPTKPSGYAELEVPEGRLKFRFHWMLKDNTAEQWAIFVQDMRYAGLREVLTALESLSEGAGNLRYSDSPDQLEDAPAEAVSSVVNCFRMGDLTFMQFFLLQ